MPLSLVTMIICAEIPRFFAFAMLGLSHILAMGILMIVSLPIGKILSNEMLFNKDRLV